MNKGKIKSAVMWGVAALLAAIFLTVLFLSVPLGGRASVLPVTVLYVVGGAVAGCYLGAAIFFLVRSGKDR